MYSEKIETVFRLPEQSESSRLPVEILYVLVPYLTPLHVQFAKKIKFDNCDHQHRQIIFSKSLEFLRLLSQPEVRLL